MISTKARQALALARAKRIRDNPLEAEPAPQAWRDAPFYVACIAARRVPGEPAPEIVARNALIAMGLAAIAPVGLRRVRKRLANGRIGRSSGLEPALLYPGYVLVGVLPGGPRLDVAFRSRLIAGMLGHDGVPMRVSRSDVGRLIDSMNAGSFDEAAPGRRCGPVVGDIVHILDGPFEGWHVEVVSLANQGLGEARACAGVRLNLLGGERVVKIPLDSLGMPGAAMGQDDRD